MLHKIRLMYRLGSTFTDFCSLFFPFFCFPIFGWHFVLIDPRGQAPMGLSMLGRAILLLEVSNLVALSLAAVNGESSPYSFPPSLNW